MQQQRQQQQQSNWYLTFGMRNETKREIWLTHFWHVDNGFVTKMISYGFLCEWYPLFCMSFALALAPVLSLLVFEPKMVKGNNNYTEHQQIDKATFCCNMRCSGSLQKISSWKLSTMAHGCPMLDLSLSLCLKSEHLKIFDLKRFDLNIRFEAAPHRIVYTHVKWVLVMQHIVWGLRLCNQWNRYMVLELWLTIKQSGSFQNCSAYCVNSIVLIFSI